MSPSPVEPPVADWLLLDAAVAVWLLFTRGGQAAQDCAVHYIFYFTLLILSPYSLGLILILSGPLPCFLTIAVLLFPKLTVKKHAPIWKCLF